MDINQLNILQYLNTKNKLYAKSTETLREFIRSNNFEFLDKFKPKLEKTIIGQANNDNIYAAIKYPQIKYPMSMEYLLTKKEKVDYGDGIRNCLLVTIDELMNQLERNSNNDFKVILKGFAKLIKISNIPISSNLTFEKTLVDISAQIFEELNCRNESELQIIINKLRTYLKITYV